MQTIQNLDKVTYPIVETFHSVQGEGAWMGVNAFFIRLAGCDVCCPWCDTKNSWNASAHPQRNLKDLSQEVKAANPAIVVVTGGEPLMHDLNPLCDRLKQLGKRIHLETSGGHPFSGQFDWVTFSPKRFKQPDPSIYPVADELKVVVVDAEDLKWAEMQASKTAKTALKYLQPEWSKKESQNVAIEYVLEHPDWRISLQTHKFLGVR